MLTEERIGELYCELNRLLCRFVNSIVKDPFTSEDIVHDAFTRLYEYSQKYDLADENLKAFLYKICRNLSLNYIKRKNHFEFIPLESVENYFHYNNVKETIGSREVCQAIEPVLTQLSHNHWLIFHLRLANQLNNQQIARQLGISERTIRRRIRECKDYLKINTDLDSMYNV